MLKINQLQCKVTDLQKAVNDFTELGFTVCWGSDPEKASNAFIYFDKGPVIELFLMPDIAYYAASVFGIFYGSSAKRRWKHWCRSNEGWCDFNLQSDNTDDASLENIGNLRNSIKDKNISVSKVIKGHRKQPDGQKLQFGYFVTDPVELPFVTSDYHIKNTIKKVKHTNGAKEIEWVKVGVSDENRAKLELLTNDDKRIVLVPSEHTNIIEIGIKGIRNKLDGSRLHGAKIVSLD